MKKVVSIFLIISLFCFQINFKIFAEFCKEPSIKIKEINFDVVLNDEGEEEKWNKQVFKDKNVELVRYEEIPNLKTRLENRGKKALKDLITAWNSQASPKLADLAGMAIIDLLTRDEISEETRKELLEGLKNKLVDDNLSDEEKIMAITDGKTEGNLATAIIGTMSAGTSTAVGVGAGFGAKALITKIGTSVVFGGGKFANFIAYATNPIVIGTLATCATFFALSYILTPAYNKLFINRREREARIDMDKSRNLFNSVGKSILRHDWINKNLLIMSTTKQPECGNVDTRFYNHTGISYEKSQQEINEDFAAAECAFLGYENDEECEKQSLNVINCIFDRKAGKHNNKCPKNYYLNNNFELVN